MIASRGRSPARSRHPVSLKYTPPTGHIRTYSASRTQVQLRRYLHMAHITITSLNRASSMRGTKSTPNCAIWATTLSVSGVVSIGASGRSTMRNDHRTNASAMKSERFARCIPGHTLRQQYHPVSWVDRGEQSMDPHTFDQSRMYNTRRRYVVDRFGRANVEGRIFQDRGKRQGLC